jgi:hypothetical protein
MSEVLSVTLVPDDKMMSTLRSAEGALTVAQSIVVESNDDAELANGELRSVKGRLTWLKERKALFVAPAKQIIAAAEGMFDEAIRINNESETYLKGQLLGWHQKEQLRVAEEKREADAKARKAAQEAEQKAAQARAQAEAEAREKEAAAQRAREASAEAEAAGNAKEAAKLAGQAARLDEQATHAIENAEAKAGDLIASAASSAASVVVAPTKTAGFSARDRWVAELQHGITEEIAVKMIVAAIGAGRTDLLAYLSLNMTAANGTAKALKAAMTLPGLVAVNRPVGTSRAA